VIRRVYCHAFLPKLLILPLSGVFLLRHEELARTVADRILGLAGLAFSRAIGRQTGHGDQIADGVWFREGDISGKGHWQQPIIEMKDYLIVVDANFPSGARLAMEDAKRLSSKPVKYVFEPHHHGDHSYGNLVWTQAGAITLAYKGVAEEMSATSPPAGRTTAKTRRTSPTDRERRAAEARRSTRRCSS